MVALVVVAVLAAVGVVAVLGWTWWRGDGELRPGSGERIAPAEVRLQEDAFGVVATLLLFTSQQDPRGPAVLGALDRLAAAHEDVAVAQVDLTRHGDLAGRYAVTRTPTVFALDAEGRLRARVKGAGDEATLRRALEAALPLTE